MLHHLAGILDVPGSFFIDDLLEGMKHPPLLRTPDSAGISGPDASLLPHPRYWLGRWRGVVRNGGGELSLLRLDIDIQHQQPWDHSLVHEHLQGDDDIDLGLLDGLFLNRPHGLHQPQ